MVTPNRRMSWICSGIDRGVTRNVDSLAYACNLAIEDLGASAMARCEIVNRPDSRR